MFLQKSAWQKIKALRVISRTSAMQYKGARKSLPQIARELSVDAVIEGSVLRSGKRVRITAQLIHAGSDRHLWAESYERDFRDVLSLQSEIAREIADQVRIILTPEERARLASALQQAFEQRSQWLGYLKVEPQLDPLQSDPRFGEMLHRLGLS